MTELEAIRARAADLQEHAQALRRLADRCDVLAASATESARAIEAGRAALVELDVIGKRGGR